MSAVVLGLVVGLGALAAIFFGVQVLGDDGDDVAEPVVGDAADDEVTSDDDPEPAETVSADDMLGPGTAVGPDNDDLATATVQVLQVDADGQPVCGGSGSIVTDDGLVLTNAHVVAPTDACPAVDLVVSTTGSPDDLPTPTLFVDVVAFAPEVDLAVLRPRETIDGAPLPEGLPFVELGDSDEVGLGDELRILGYPAIGGETITLTVGTVSGFTSSQGEPRQLIKTDASISGGNSGGMAVDADGRLVGVPSQAGATVEPGRTTDCRLIEDTNGDGRIDDADSCIPIGGFINGIRPVNVAIPLIDQARTAEPMEPEPMAPEEAVEVDADFSNLRFGPDATDAGGLTEEAAFLPVGTTSICGEFDFEGMQDGVEWDALFFLDGELLEEASRIGDRWQSGESGSQWTCAINDAGFGAGTYELTLNIQGEIERSDAILVGDTRVESFDMVNALDQQVCFVNISPAAALNWGQDHLRSDQVLPAGETVSFDIAVGVYDLRVLDCDGTVLDTGFDFTLQAGQIITLDGSGAPD